MKTLLIAAHAEALAAALSHRLTQYRVHVCHTGPDAARYIDALRPEILILELGLPGLDGLSVLRQVSHRPATILALTNWVSHAVMHEIGAAGVDALVLLPCSAQHVVHELDNLIDSKT